jgi:cell division protease FtsH
MTEADVARNERDAVIRSLALRAIGRTGADIERLVREARQIARRQGRPLAYEDIATRLDTGKPLRSHASKWRRAVHEAGHAIARHHLGLGTVDLVTINGMDGESFVDGCMDSDVVDSESALMDRMVSLLAGRAAEDVTFGAPGLGSGGSISSDLAKATEIALGLEIMFGMGKTFPLVYVTHATLALDRSDQLKLLDRINVRLESAYEQASKLIQCNAEQLEGLAQLLMKSETLEGDSLLAAMRSLKQGSRV